MEKGGKNMFKKEKWRLIMNEVDDSAMSASLADSVFQLYRNGTSSPAIIFNRANNISLVISHHQRVKNDVNEAVLRENGIKLIRRKMGGKAILLTPNDVFYQIIGSVQNETIDKNIVKKAINKQFAKALHSLANKGISIEIMNEEENNKEPYNPIFYRACFLRANPYEITVNGKKLGAFTHMASRGIFLHEGYLPYENYADQLMHLLKAQPDEDKTNYHHIISSKTISLKEVIGSNVSYETIIEAIVKELKAELSINIEHGSFTTEEIDLAQKIYDEKYNHEVWIYRR